MSMGYDFLLLTNRGSFPIERKAIPGDLIASVQDGRLQREFISMRETNPNLYLILLHGEFKFKGQDLIMPSKKQRIWTKKGIRNLMRSLQLMEGAVVERAKNDEELVEIINEWQKYLDEDTHRSIRVRPRIDTDGFSPIRVERIRYFYAGLPSSSEDKIRCIGMEKAKTLQRAFPNPIDLYKTSIEDIAKVEGFGKKLSEGIYNFLRGV
jgi:ERCC4-type nuclease